MLKLKFYTEIFCLSKPVSHLSKPHIWVKSSFKPGYTAIKEVYDLILGLDIHLLPYFVYASSEG